MKSTTTLAVTLFVATAAALAPVAAAATVAPVGAAPTDAVTAPTDATPAAQSTTPHGGDHPPDPDEDVLGWEKVGDYGLWYNESIDVDNSDGLNESELDQLVARTMARVERVRQLEFEKSVPVTVRSREQYRENVSKRYANVSEEDSLHQNVKYEATFMVGEDTDTIAAQQSNRASTVLGFYSPSQDQIVIISENASSLQMDELTLSHELAHALQDQQFNITGYNQSTEELNNAVSGIVEGDAHYTEKLYNNRCNNRSHPWNGTCVRPTGGSGGGAGDVHIGIFLVSFQPYSDGPPFVHRLRQQGGWEAVNQVYDNPPASTEQVIHPRKYPNETPARVSIQDSSSDPWRVLELGNDSIDFASFGEGGLFAMFWYPSYETRSNQIIPFNDLFSEVQYDAYSYEARITDGWNGDKLLPYVTGESNETNETGYVWKLKWDTTEDAEQFVSGYERMLEFRGASKVDGRVDTWKISDDKKFGDAFYVERQGKTVVIVNGPTVEELPKIREGAAPQAQDTTTTTSADGTTTMDDGTTTMDDGTTTMDDGTTAMDDGTTAMDGTDGTTGGGDGDGGGDGSQGLPGFGFVVAVVALLAAATLLRRRR